MKIDSISCNNTFTSRSIKISANPKNISQISTNSKFKSNASDSVLLYFAGLLSAFGFSKPLNTLIGKLR